MSRHSSPSICRHKNGVCSVLALGQQSARVEAVFARALLASAANKDLRAADEPLAADLNSLGIAPLTSEK